MLSILRHKDLEVLEVLEVLATHEGVAPQLISLLTSFGRSSLSQLVTQARSTQSRRVIASGCSLSRQRTKPTPSLIFYRLPPKGQEDTRAEQEETVKEKIQAVLSGKEVLKKC